MAHYLWTLRPYYRQTAGQLVLGSLAGVVMNTAVVLPAVCLGRAIDAATHFAHGQATRATLLQAVALFAAATLATELPRLGKRWWLMTANARIRANLRADALRGVLAWPMAKLTATPVGDTMARVIGDVEVLGIGIREVIVETWDTLLFLMSFFVAMLVLDWSLTLQALIPVPFAMVLAWAAAVAARRAADARHTYGWQRASLLAALANALLLLMAMGSLGWEAVQRLSAPQPTAGWTLIAVAGVGIVVNTATALLFLRGSHGNLNIRGAFLHMAADALMSLGVVLAGALYLWRGWAWIDPVLSLAIAVVIVVGTWGLLRQSVHLLFDGVPSGIDLAAVRRGLLAVPGVAGLHDLHVWAMGSTETALTAHLLMPERPADDLFLADAAQQLQARFGIAHVTLQAIRTPAGGAASPTALDTATARAVVPGRRRRSAVAGVPGRALGGVRLW